MDHEINEEIKRCIETNDTEDSTIQNLWDTAKAVLRGKFIAIQSYLRKEEKTQINNLTLHLKHLEKEEQTKPKISRRKEIKIRAEINEIQTKKTIEKINETKSWFLKKIKNLIYFQPDSPRKKGERAEINKIKNEKGEVTADITEKQRIMRGYCEQLYANKMGNLEEMDKFL